MIDYKLDADGVATLTWDMPGRSMNVLNKDSLDRFADLIEQVAGDAAVKGVIVTSGKPAFIAGADLDKVKEMMSGPKDPTELTRITGVLNTILRRLETCGKPVAAAINGTALGGGYEICLACHYRVVADDERIELGLPESKLGLLPGGGGTQRLPRLIGVQPALMLMMEGRSLGPAAARAQGLVNKVVPAGELLAEARRWILEQGDPVQPWDKRGAKAPDGGAEGAAFKQTFVGANAMTRAKTFGNYPAARAILSCVYEGMQVTLDAGLKIETRYFTGLLIDPVARNMVRTLFLNLQDANKLIRRPEGVPRSRVNKLGVLGAGLMGAGVAYVSARAGIEVVLIDRTLEAAEKGKGYSARIMDKAIARKRSTDADKEALLGRILPSVDYEDLKGCDLIVEAVFEDRAVKAEVTRKAEAVISETCVFGSNTSTLPITGLAEASSRPGCFIGIHYFSPVEMMPLVEVIRGKETTDEALARTLDYIQQIKKTPIVVNDSRGFYTSRVFGTYVTEGMSMLREGILPALIENAGRLSGMPMPPLALADEVGLDLMVHVGEQTRADLGDAYVENPSSAVLEVLVKQLGRFGRKNARGCYDYPESGPKRLSPTLSEHFPPRADQPEVQALVDRFLVVQAVEAARCMEEGVLLAAADADVGAIMGWGFAPFTGGPLSFIDTMGLPAFVEKADGLAEVFGDRFKAPELLRAMARDGATFY